MALFSALAATVVFAAIVLATALGSEPESTPDFPASEPFAAGQTERIHEIRDRVSDVRGLPVSGEVEEGVISRDRLREFYAEAFDELTAADRREFAAQSSAFRLLGFLGPDDDIEDVFSEFGSEGIAGLYIPAEKRLIIIGDQIGVSEELTIAHEFVHSFQDARYGIEALQAWGERDQHTELATTIPCVFEGDATLASVLYMNSRYGLEWITRAQSEAQAQVAAQAADLESLPEGMLRYFTFNYSECVTFALGVFRDRGWPGIDQLYTNPPTTTEQILHPDKYFDGEGARRLETQDLRHALGPGWKHLDGWAFGEFDVLNYLLTAGVSRLPASRAAEGWAGGRLELYASTRPDSEDAVVYITLAWDSDDDLNEFRSVLEAAVSDATTSSLDEFVDYFGWSPLNAQAFAVWNSRDQRVELVFASDEAALERAKQGVLR